MTSPADEHSWQELRAQLNRLQRRVEQLEDAIAMDLPEVDEIPSGPTVPVANSSQIHREETAPKISLPPTPAEMEPHTPWRTQQPFDEKIFSRESSDESWESMIGGRWLTWLGSASLVLAMLFFAFWTWQHLETPAWLRVLSFHLTGIGMLAIAHWLNSKQLPRLSQGLAGLGIFTLYIASYVMHHHYHLWGNSSATVAFIDCALITLVAIGIALNANSVAIILLGALGGYLTPLLSLFGENDYVPGFLYLAFLNVALIACSTLRPWQFLKPIVVAATACMFLAWMLSSGSAVATDWRTEWLLVLHATIVLLGTTLPPLLWRQRSSGADLVALVTNSLWFVGATWMIFHHRTEQQMAAVCWGMSALHTTLFVWTFNRVTNTDRMPRYQLALATVFFTLAIPLQMHHSLDYLAYAWAVEGVVFAALAVYFSDSQMARSCHLVLTLALIRAFAFDYTALPEALGSLAIDRRLLVLLCTGLATMAAGSCYWWVGKIAPPREATPLNKDEGGVLLALGNIVLLISFTCQWSSRIILVLWTLDAAMVWIAALYFRSAAARTYAFLLSALMVGWRICYHGDSVEQPFQLLLNARFTSLSLAALLYLLAAWWQRKTLPCIAECTREIHGSYALILHYLGNAVLLIAITMEVHYWYNPSGNWASPFSMGEQVSHSVVWAIYAALLVAIGFLLKYRLPRVLGLMMLLAVVVKVFFVDLASLALIFRVLALSILGAMLLITSFWYQKFTARIDANMK